jgi:hypothetical protein
MRHRLFRRTLSEIGKATRLEKIILLIPFIFLIVDAEIFYYSLVHHELTIIIASVFVLLLSVLAIIAAIQEIYSYVSRVIKNTGLENIVKEAIMELNNPPVKQVVEKILTMGPVVCYSRSEIYHMVCKPLHDKNSL